MGPVLGAIRLLDEDPDGWVVHGGDLYHPHTHVRLVFDETGPISVNGFVLGWWRRWLLRRAVWRRETWLVDDYLERRRTERARAEEAEVDRLLAG